MTIKINYKEEKKPVESIEITSKDTPYKLTLSVTRNGNIRISDYECYLFIGKDAISDFKEAIDLLEKQIGND
jgi:hypothetical protein